MAKVCLDAGHYGRYNVSPANGNYVESKRMWDLHLLQKKYLEQLGVEVVTTRDEQEKDLALSARGKKAKGCDVIISDHTNAVGNGVNDEVDYVVAYVMCNDSQLTCDEEARELAQKLVEVTAKVMGTTQAPRVTERLSENDKDHDGVKDDNYYGVLAGARTVEVAAMILENSFHTNTRMTNWLLNDANLDKLARRQAEVIASHVLKREVKLDAVPASTVTPSGGYKYSKGQYVTVSTHYAGKNDPNEKAVGVNPHLNMKIVAVHYGARNPYQTDFGTFINDGDIRGIANGSSLAAVQAKEAAVKTAPAKEEIRTSDGKYVIGNTYTLVADGLRVRKGPGTDYPKLSYNELSANAKKHAYSTGTLKKGTKVTCKDIALIGSSVWIETPSGWMCAYNGKKTYIA